MIANLTAAEWSAVCSAVAHHQVYLEDVPYPGATRERQTLGRAFTKIRQLAPEIPRTADPGPGGSAPT